ncbi:hypothetical protein ES703_99582 [subsurface metagenome]
MIAGDVKVIGRREGVFQAYGSTGNHEPIRKLFFKDLHTPDTCQLAAEKIKDDMENPIITGRFNFIDTGLTYDVDDIVQIVDEDFGLDTDYRIYEHEKWITPERVYAQLMYCNLINMTGNGPLLINRGTGFLIKGQEALKQVTRTQTGLRDEVRLFKYNGEDITGYSPYTGGLGVLTTSKDYCRMQSGAGVGQVILQSRETIINLANELSIDVRFKINNRDDYDDDRHLWLGSWHSGTLKGIYFGLDGFYLYGACANGLGNVTTLAIDDPIAANTWYRLSCFKRGGKVYYYYDGVYVGSISTDIPTFGSTTALYSAQDVARNPGANNFILYYDQFEMTEKNVAAY